MPAKSKSQQRLMGQAYAVKKGDMSLDEVDPNYRDEVERLADEMSLEDLKDFAETKHDDLPDKVEEYFKNKPKLKKIFDDMGSVELPSASANIGVEGGELGSGDALHPMTYDEFINSDEDEEDENNKEKNENRNNLTYLDRLNEHAKEIEIEFKMGGKKIEIEVEDDIESDEDESEGDNTETPCGKTSLDSNSGGEESKQANSDIEGEATHNSPVYHHAHYMDNEANFSERPNLPKRGRNRALTNRRFESKNVNEKVGLDNSDEFKKAKNLIIQARDSAFDIANDIEDKRKKLSKLLRVFQGLVNKFEKLPNDPSKQKKHVENIIEEIEKQQLSTKLKNTDDLLLPKEEKYERKLKNIANDVSNVLNKLKKSLKNK